MSYEPVDVFVSTSLGDPIEGVVIKVLNESGTITYGLQTTDVDGKASFLLPAPATYQTRLFKRQVNIKNPQMVVVTEAPITPEENQFDVMGEVFDLPVSIDPRICIASGYLRRPDGSPAPNVDIHFIAKWNPLLLDGDAVITERVTVRSDNKGFVSVNLIRFGKYQATVEGMEDYQRCVSVPDLASTNIANLLFPRVASVSFDAEGPYALTVDQEITITPTLVTTAGVILDGTSTGDVTWRITDASIAAISLTDTTLKIRGVAPGTTTLTCERLDASTISIPNVPIVGQPISITVT